MDREKRNGDNPLPDNLEEMLSEAQRRTLPGIKFAGWEPQFLRKKAFQPPTLVMQNSNDGRIGLMDEDGRFTIQDGIKVREEDGEIPDPSPNNLHFF